VENLVSAAYRASEEGIVVLALHQLPPEALEPHMDRAVRLHGMTVHGVLYLQVNSAQAEALRYAAEADFVVADSLNLSRGLSSGGIRHMGSSEGVRFLQQIVSRPEAGRL